MARNRDNARAGTEVTGAPTTTSERRDERVYGTTSTLKLEWLEERSDREQAWIAVAVACDGRTVTGLSPSVGRKRRRHGVHRAVLATIDAIEQLARRRVSCELIDVGRTRADDGTWVKVRLRLSVDGDAAVVHGRARVRDGVADAAARAVLDAASEFVHAFVSRLE